MTNRRSLIIFVFAIFIFSSICFAYPSTSKIENVPDNESVVEFRGCVRGNTQIIRDLYREIDAKAYVLGVETIQSIDGPLYGGESFLKYKFIGEGKKIRILKKETIDAFISKWRSNIEEVE